MEGRKKYRRVWFISSLGTLLLVGLVAFNKFNFVQKPGSAESKIFNNEATSLSNTKNASTLESSNQNSNEPSEKSKSLAKEKGSTTDKLSVLLDDEKQLATELNSKQLQEEISILEKELHSENASEMLNKEATSLEQRRKLEEKIIKLSALKLVEIENKTKEVQSKFAKLTKGK